MMARYHEPVSDEWIYPQRRGYKMSCCDCGLVHQMDFRIVKDVAGRSFIEFRVRRDNRATAAVRRHLPSTV